ncbi:MAG: DivIVA domain-containing protein [Myxococcota bacterium]
MRMTPLDIQSHRFGRRFSGLDPEEVESFLRMVAEDYEQLLRDNETLSDQIRRLETRVDELGSREQVLQDTLVSAQAMTEDMRKAALKEAELTLSEAEVKAEKILDAAHRRASRLAEEIREMVGLRTRLATALRAAIDTHLSLIDSLEEDSPEEAHLDGKVTYLSRPASPRASSAPEPGGGG